MYQLNSGIKFDTASTKYLLTNKKCALYATGGGSLELAKSHIIEECERVAVGPLEG